MATRNRSMQDWDPMRDDFDDTNYSPQYADDNASENVTLDFNRLYITKFPDDLEQSGLEALFSKYGTIEHAFIHRTAQKQYAFVHFSTPGEAKLALMKLNKAEPLKLSIHYAHKKTNQNNTSDRNANKRAKDGNNVNARNYGQERNNFNHREREDFNTSNPPSIGRERDIYNVRDKEESNSVSSFGRSSVRMINGDNSELDLSMKEDSAADLDPELQIELERIQLEKLKLQQAQLQCKERLLIKQAERRARVQATPVSRCLLPGGKVVVRSGSFGVTASNDNDADIGGGGDSPTASRACTACGRGAEAFCARCGITPYCSAACQRRDWVDRHRDVCHNLARVSSAAPLRRPRSPAKITAQHSNRISTGERNAATPDINDSGSDKVQGKPRQNDTQGQKNNRNNSNRGGNRTDNRNQNRSDNRNDNRTDNRKDNRFNRKPQQNEENEEWGSPAAPKPSQQPQAAPKPEQVKSPAPSLKPLRQPFKQANHEPTKPAQEPTKPIQEPTKPTQVPTKPAQEPTQQTKGKPPADVSAVTPIKKLVPKNCLIETLSLGEEVIISVDNTTANCRAGADGFVCLTLHSSAEENYQKLCDDYANACGAQTATVTPKPGDAFSYLDPSDGAWYRARCVSATSAALLDCGRIVTITGATCKPLPPPYDAIPEYCCLLRASVKLGDSLKCVLKSKLPRGFEVLLANIESGEDVGHGEVLRWLPEVEYAPPANTPPANAPATVVIPEVDRPNVRNKSEVFMVDATAADRVMVAPTDPESQRKFNDALQKTLMYAATASPLQTPPTKGQMVISKFTDGLHYRALIKRTNVKQNKYLLEYIEYGNNHISALEDLYPCPPELSTTALPTMTSCVRLQVRCEPAFTQTATAYIETVKEDTELLLTLPDGSETAPSGSEVVLTVIKTKENVNRKIEELCTPQWKKIEERGGDVVEVEPIMFSSVEYLPFPSGGCTLEILDLSLLTEGSVCAYPSGHPHAQYVFTTLTSKMEEYCNSEIGKQPYLPKDEELCIAQCPPYPQWFRAALVERVGDPGSDQMRVLYIDYGNMEVVSAKLLRKMLPEFVTGLPALVCSVDIRDFPKEPTEAQLAKALEVMKVNEEGRGVLQITRCVPGAEPGSYIGDAPHLIEAMRSV